jgi:spore coat polysaccharide biosynthesis predicted glycosyltransferase SpsG
MRCLALSEELVGRGVRVTFVCAAWSVPWVARALADRAIDFVPPAETPEEHTRLLSTLGADAVVFDSYRLPSEVYRAVREASLRTLALVDGDLRGAEADLLLDQNIGSELDDVAVPPGTRRLAGLMYALLRDDILAHRPAQPRPPRYVEVPEVFAVFGGTDPLAAGPVVAALLTATGLPFHATFVAPRPQTRAEIERLAIGHGQRITVVGATDRFADHAAAADLVISASGSSTWELMCIGAATALVCVADNQATGYARAVRTRAVAALGELVEIRAYPAAPLEVLVRLLESPSARGELARAGWSLVDGQGRVRVADALLGLGEG